LIAISGSTAATAPLSPAIGLPPCLNSSAKVSNPVTQNREGMAGLGRNAAVMGAHAATDEDTGVETRIKESVIREAAIVLFLALTYPTPLDRPLRRSFQLADLR
jgi:hypothetical protein